MRLTHDGTWLRQLTKPYDAYEQRGACYAACYISRTGPAAAAYLARAGALRHQARVLCLWFSSQTEGEARSQQRTLQDLCANKKIFR